MRFKKLLAVSLTAPVLVLTACSGSDEGDDTGASDQASQEQSSEEGAAPEPDLDGIPEVVAEVDGTEIGRDEFVEAYRGSFQQQATQAQTTGQPVDQEALKEQTAQSLVSRYLLTQEAADRGIEASESDVDDSLTTLAEQNQMSPEEFLAALEEQGMAESEVRSQLESQVEVDGLVADEAGPIKPTEAEMRKVYDDAKARQQQSGGAGQQLPPYRKVKDQLAEQVRSQKEAAVTEKLEKGLRSQAEITIHL